MKSTRKNKGNLTPFSKGKLNKLIDDAIHPFFDTNKAFILIDGIAHGLVEQNPSLSLKKFVKYNVPELMKTKKSQRRISGGTRRSYTCKFPVNNRYMFCSYKRAGPRCLRLGVWRTRCPRLIISYKRIRPYCL